MANGRNKGRKGDTGRDPGGFVALPWSVLDCPAYARLSHPARSLLWEFARQAGNDNNGRLLASRAHLAARGWNSAGVIDRAKSELLAAGFIHETVQGHRPNKASWYAVTWRTLDRHPGYDVGAAETFERGAYRKNTSLGLSERTGATSIGLSERTGARPPVLSKRTIRANSGVSSVLSERHHLDKPSAAPVTPAVDLHPSAEQQGPKARGAK